MKTKYFLIYLGIGIAFAAVSLWVFLSRGKNAKAIRAKYKLGGALLTTWALLSAATCAGPKPELLCYDMPAPTNQLAIEANASGEMTFTKGDVLKVHVMMATAEHYSWKITSSDRKMLLQEGKYDMPEEPHEMDINLEVTLESGSFKGDAVFVLTAYYYKEDGTPIPEEVATQSFRIR